MEADRLHIGPCAGKRERYVPSHQSGGDGPHGEAAVLHAGPAGGGSAAGWEFCLQICLAGSGPDVPGLDFVYIVGMLPIFFCVLFRGPSRLA